VQELAECAFRSKYENTVSTCGDQFLCFSLSTNTKCVVVVIVILLFEGELSYLFQVHRVHFDYQSIGSAVGPGGFCRIYEYEPLIRVVTRLYLEYLLFELPTQIFETGSFFEFHKTTQNQLSFPESCYISKAIFKYDNVVT